MLVLLNIWYIEQESEKLFVPLIKFTIKIYFCLLISFAFGIGIIYAILSCLGRLQVQLTKCISINRYSSYFQ